MRSSRLSTLLERAKSPRTLKILARCAVSLGALAAVTGCDTKGFLSPPDQLGYFKQTREPLVVPILKTLDPSVEENDKIFVNATDPTPADRKLQEVDYRISANDMLSIGISDLVATGQEQIETRRVTENGMISLPYIGAIRAEGLTEIEFEQEVVQAYKDMQLIQNANVSVTVVEPRGRSFEILGAVGHPAAYAIPQANFRVLDALVVGGDVAPNAAVENIYIIRRIEKERPPTRPFTRPAIPTTTPVPNPGDLAPRGQLSQPPAPLASSKQNQNGERALNLLADTSAPEPAMKANAGGSFVEPTAAHPAEPAAIPVEPSHPILAQAGNSDRGFAFNAPVAPADVRVIRIPYQALRDGDLNYNIPLRPYDVVWVQPLPSGVYYVYGHVLRPGVFTLAGQKVTIKQAIGGAGMFDELAVPQRTEIVRRVRPDHEIAMRIDLQRIFNMEEPDVYLKPDDQIFVGTNAIAPFIAAIRGAFRITYGFGFLYDRNFAYNNVAGAF